MQDKIRGILVESADLKRRVAETLAPDIARVAHAMIEALRGEGIVAFCGNGGSAADAQHLAGELVGRFQINRRAYASIAFTTDTSVLTAIGNDFGFDQVYSRQVEALLREGDMLVAISTSGNADNCVKAVQAAQERGVVTVGMTGESGGKLAELCDLCLRVPHSVTARIQEAHICIGHILCGLVEEALAD